jgi:hypothetical protein
MNKTTFIRQELSIPTGAMLDVADILTEEEMHHEITGTDPDSDSLIIAIEYDADQREAFHAIEDAIEDFLEQEDDDADDSDEK